MPLASVSHEYKGMANTRHRFGQQSGHHNRSGRNSTTRLNGFSLRVFLNTSTKTDASHGLETECQWTRNHYWGNKMLKTLNSQNAANLFLRHAFRSQLVP